MRSLSRGLEARVEARVDRLNLEVVLEEGHLWKMAVRGVVAERGTEA